ncbi:hypothetical protein J2128_000009 [Methanomicrobium sp. W14]|uniref:hypothetical protein n=1 Tax=Methanomicrobium sp. W14 TaxID=2817839 RepID=UPI001AE4E9C4|nr:hypothetical protein [Methanomicrobium sp. W14]MBP2132088.1 hypothetical protein [Methanomicrobium sp. W14]
MSPTRNEDGLSEVIGIILILALIVIFLSLWVVYAVPADGRQDEIEHMDYVQNWFTQYKITADSLWINYNDNSESRTSGITVSDSLMLGSQGGATNSQGLFLALMRPFGSSGTISVENEGPEFFEIRNGSGVFLNGSLVRVQYEAQNNYWIHQTYYYQMGGVFLNQSDGTVNRISPLISFGSNGSQKIANIIIINITPGKATSISGEGPTRIDTVLTRISDQERLEGDHDLDIELTLQDESAAKAWRSILRGLGGNASVVGNKVTVSGLSEVYYRYANYTVSLQSVAASLT